MSFRGFDLNFAGLETPGYFNEVWAAVDGVHVLGEDLWARALRRGCPSDVPHALIPPAVDVSRFDPGPPRRAEVMGTPHRPLRLLSVGRLEWKKGYEFALQAVGLLRDRGLTVDYRIVGEGPPRGGRLLSPAARARRLRDAGRQSGSGRRGS